MDSETRKRVMRSIRKKDTRPELAVRRLLHSCGYRYRLHRRDLPGTPDIVLPRYHTIIFVHGCFWHQHDCSLANVPATNQQYWLPKLRRNVERDEAARDQLEKAGWHVLVVWECQAANADALKGRLLPLLDANAQTNKKRQKH